MSRVLAIIPAYHEAANLPLVIGRIREHCPDWHIVVVDDGSTDETSAVAEAHGATVLRLVVNLGIGGAVQTGLMYARNHDYDICLQIDGDGQHDPRESLHLVEKLLESEADAVIGSRFLAEGGYRSSFARRAGIRTLRGVLRLLCGRTITDPTSGQRALGKRAIAVLARDYPQQYPEPEAVYLLQRYGLRLLEVPVCMQERASGASSIRPLHSLLYMAKVIVGLLAQAMAGRKELYR